MKTNKSISRILPLFIALTMLALFPSLVLADDPPCCTVFLPLVFGGGNTDPAPQPPPTPLLPTTPITGMVQTLWPVRAVGVMSQDGDYQVALNGVGYVSGNDVFGNPFLTPQNVTYSLINQFFFGLSYQIGRSYVEFNTTAIPADFETAQFNLTIYRPYAGPPAHLVAVHRGTWPTGGLTADDQFLPENWSAYQPAPVAILPGGDPNVAEWQKISVTLPRELINPGGVTKLVFRSTVEGTVPNTHLGGAFAGLSLTVK